MTKARGSRGEASPAARGPVAGSWYVRAVSALTVNGAVARDRVGRLAAPAALLLLGAIAYSSSLRGPFVFDDLDSISGNPVIRDLGNYFGGTRGLVQVPNRWFGYLTFALNHAAGGLDPFGYHLVNVGLHLANALLVYALVRATLRTPRLAGSAVASSRAVAFVAAALFIAHPIQTQAVTYVVQRLTSLATTLYLVAVVQYVRWRLAEAGSPHRATYASALVTAVLAMNTKEIAFTLPFVICVYEVLFFGPVGRRRLVSLSPFLATAAIIPAVLLARGSGGGSILADVSRATHVEAAFSRLDYLATQLPVLVKYLRLLVFPVGQNLDYDHPLHTSFLDPRVLGSAVILLALVAAAAILLVHSAAGRGDPGERLVAFGIAWFFVTISVESSVIPITDLVNEHRVYLPSAGMALAVAVAAGLAVLRPGGARRVRALVAAGTAAAIVLAVATFRRNEVWSDDVTLWRDAAEKSPLKARPRLNYGKALFDRGDVDGAIEQYLAGVALDPRHAKLRNNLGVALHRKGRVDDAIVQFRAAIAIEPRYAEAHGNLGVAYGKKGWVREAGEEISLGLRLRSGGR